MSEFEISLGYRGPHLKKQNKQKYTAKVQVALLTALSLELTAKPFLGPQSTFLNEIKGKHLSVLVFFPFLVVMWILNQFPVFNYMLSDIHYEYLLDIKGMVLL